MGPLPETGSDRAAARDSAAINSQLDTTAASRGMRENPQLRLHSRQAKVMQIARPVDWLRRLPWPGRIPDGRIW
jgi:hypothetical protein